MTAPEAAPGSYAHFLDEVAAQRVFVSGLDDPTAAWVTVTGEATDYATQFTASKFIYRAIADELVTVFGGRVRLRYARPGSRLP